MIILCGTLNLSTCCNAGINVYGRGLGKETDHDEVEGVSLYSADIIGIKPQTPQTRNARCGVGVAMEAQQGWMNDGYNTGNNGTHLAS